LSYSAPVKARARRLGCASATEAGYPGNPSAIGGQVFVNDSVVASAAVDRLLHRCTIINLRGDSYRLKEERKANKTSFLAPTEPELKP